MTSINPLISNVLAAAPFSNEIDAQTFLNNYGVDDQAAIISSLYIGRDHIHLNQMDRNYIPQGLVFDRYFITGGNGTRWHIEPADFASILYEKGSSLQTYYSAFLRCVPSPLLFNF